MKTLFTLFFIISSMLFAQKQLFIVDCTESWQNTNFTVAQDEKVIFIAHGYYSDGSGGFTSLTSWSSPDGRGTQRANNNLGYSYVTQDYPIGSLIGKVGSSGEIFGVGSYTEKSMPTSGNIYLTVNDATSGFGDNSGTLAVQMVKGSIVAKQLFIVDCTESWQNTNFSVAQDEMVIFIAHGYYSDGSGGFTSLTSWSSPDGRGTQRANNNLGYSYVTQEYPIGSLIGKVGSGGEVFGVGSYTEKSMPTSGNIYLTVNDATSGFGDNSGTLAVQMVKISIGTTSIDEPNNGTIDSYELYQNYPNPFNPNTKIEYKITQHEYVNVNIFDINGKLIKTLVNKWQNPGQYSVNWDGENNLGENVASGTYFYQIKTGEFMQSKKMIYLK